MQIQPIDACISELKAQRDYDEVIFTSPDGELGFSGNLVRKVFPQAVQANPTSPDNKEYWGFEQTATVGGVEAENVLFTVNGEDIATPIFQKSNL